VTACVLSPRVGQKKNGAAIVGHSYDRQMLGRAESRVVCRGKGRNFCCTANFMLLFRIFSFF